MPECDLIILHWGIPRAIALKCTLGDHWQLRKAFPPSSHDPWAGTALSPNHGSQKAPPAVNASSSYRLHDMPQEEGEV